MSVKKRRKKINFFKRLLLLILVVLMMVIIATRIHDVYAANKATDEEVNDFRVSDLKTTIKETFTPPKDLNVNTPIEKNVTILNDQHQDVFIRVLVLPTIIAKSSGGEDLILPASFKGENPQLAIPFETTNWIDGEDGYFYYTKKLKKGEKSTSLFKQVRIISENINKHYLNAEVTIEIKVEGINTTPFAYRDAWWAGETPTKEPRIGIDTQLKLQIE
ncbi:hypothetical protein [Candidatus Enterococcus mansonii]|uniref:Alternate signal-mediated exported protein n=1 Tax=Candidatus Enterococcus mansonii TaxID=1834181 RepID=A0A242CIC7_9ENTE|nr:hypothetical protein [Enterococcus sp. 4G2_DIV0659]OTO09660.1 hypothetical protein A5880_000340 [Enterococcus sp. 4G2_DIV0659]